jgi:hypothetical protein
MPRAGSAHGKPILQTALGPQDVQSARNLQWRALPDIALEAFAVVPDRLDDPVRPILARPSDIESGPIALWIGHAEAGQHAVRTANELTAILNRFERLRGCHLRAKRQASLQWQKL